MSKQEFYSQYVSLMAGAAVCFADQPSPPAVQTQPVITPLEQKPTEATVETKPPVAEVATAPVATPLWMLRKSVLPAIP